MGEAAARRQRTVSRGALPSAFASPKATRGGLAKKLVEVSVEVNQRLADGVRRVAPPIGIDSTVTTAKLTAGGTPGSLTFVGGSCVSSVQAT